MPKRVKVKLANPGILTWARESAGYSTAEIAHAVKKSEDDISAWEKGVEAPTFRQLEILANKVKRPVATFFLPEVPVSPPNPKDFRTIGPAKHDVFEPQTLLAFRKAREVLADALMLIEELEVDIKFGLPSWTLNDSPDEIASVVRSLIGISVHDQIRKPNINSALNMWRDALFNQGIISLVFRYPIQDARAFCDFKEELAVIGLNTTDTTSGRIFSLFHELCHLCLRLPGVSSNIPKKVSLSRQPNLPMERFCDKFAASFLLPYTDDNVLKALYGLHSDSDKSSFQDVASRFKVSKYVVLKRAFDLNRLDEDNYWSRFSSWSSEDSQIPKKEHQVDYVVNQVSHLGKRFAALVFAALDTQRISTYDASKILSMDSKYFAEARLKLPIGMDYA